MTEKMIFETIPEAIEWARHRKEEFYDKDMTIKEHVEELWRQNSVLLQIVEAIVLAIGKVTESEIEEDNNSE